MSLILISVTNKSVCDLLLFDDVKINFTRFKFVFISPAGYWRSC